MSNKIIVTCAVTGSAETYRTNPAVPITPEHIATAALEAEGAGASIAHIHVRDPETGKASGRLDLFQDVVERIRAGGSQLILELSCGRGGTFAFDAGTLEPGVLAKSNAQQVEQAVRQIGYLGFDVASPREARDMLGLHRH
jgi:uncharacterized protein (DUF849 family)